MPRDIPEADWKLFRELRELALNASAGVPLAKLRNFLPYRTSRFMSATSTSIDALMIETKNSAEPSTTYGAHGWWNNSSRCGRFA